MKKARRLSKPSRQDRFVTLDEEKHADKLLNDLALKSINRDAAKGVSAKAA